MKLAQVITRIPMMVVGSPPMLKVLRGNEGKYANETGMRGLYTRLSNKYRNSCYFIVRIYVQYVYG